MASREVDILIVGGGLMGALLLLALTHAGYDVVLVDEKLFSTRVSTDFDARSLALSPSSVRILQMLNVWSSIQQAVTAIETIHVSEQGCFGQTRLHNPESPLGYVIEIQQLTRILHTLLNPQQIIAPATVLAFNPATNVATIRTDGDASTVHAHLIVAADGADSSLRQFCKLDAHIKDYAQHAIVANIGLARAHQHIAYERFTTMGPLALLPMTDSRAALVWSMSPGDASYWQSASEQDFLKHLQHSMGYRLGRFCKVGHRSLFPLRQVTMTQLVKGAVVFIGNAAHTLHPVAGQGFNLGLRDVAMLAQCIVQHGLNDAMLQRYQQSRRHDQQTIQWFTQGIIEVFARQMPGMAIARSCGLILLDQVPMLKNTLTRYAQGLGGVIPDLVCGLSL